MVIRNSGGMIITEWHIESAKRRKDTKTESAKLTFKIEGGTKRFSEKKNNNNRKFFASRPFTTKPLKAERKGEGKGKKEREKDYESQPWKQQ